MGIGNLEPSLPVENIGSREFPQLSANLIRGHFTQQTNPHGLVRLPQSRTFAAKWGDLKRLRI